ncbi:MAG: hypothetical protein LUH00_13485 [Lachnospiraceae bacterium]|nr:hypothetical protein [Lachnospiraceae bacterium]
MKEKWKVVKSVFLSDWSPMEKGLLLADVLLFGILLGWLTSPIKGGISLFSHNSFDASSDDHSANGFDFDEEDDREEE